MILAIDTSTQACSAALLLDDNTILADYQLAPREQTQLILPMIQGLLAQANLSLSQLDALAFAAGPGSFTGLRLAAGLIQGLAFGADLPVISVSTLATMAQRAYVEYEEPKIIVSMDAYMNEVYCGLYQLNTQTQLMQFSPVISAFNDKDIILSRANFASAMELFLASADNQSYLGIGDGWQFANKKPKKIYTEYYSDAKSIIPLAKEKYSRQDYNNAFNIAPNYLRTESAWRMVK
jgi:tRNA threonylcarbamoyladenosine biosynthesis protein TsaB